MDRDELGNYEDYVFDDMLQAMKDATEDGEGLYDLRRLTDKTDDREAISEALHDHCWNDDGVTGNPSGSYTFNSYKARELVYDNIEAFLYVCDQWGEDVGEAIGRGWEYCDVLVRCFAVDVLADDVVDEFENMLSEELGVSDIEEWQDYYDIVDDAWQGAGRYGIIDCDEGRAVPDYYESKYLLAVAACSNPIEGLEVVHFG